MIALSDILMGQFLYKFQCIYKRIPFYEIHDTMKIELESRGKIMTETDREKKT